MLTPENSNWSKKAVKLIKFKRVKNISYQEILKGLKTLVTKKSYSFIL